MSGSDHGFLELGGAVNDVFLDGRDLLRRDFDSQIAAGHHDAIGNLQNVVEMLDSLGFFEFGDDPGFETESRNSIAHQAHVLSGADKGNRNGIDAILECEFKILGVLLCEGRNAHQNTGQVYTFVFTQHAAIDDVAGNIVSKHLVNTQFDQTVGE